VGLAHLVAGYLAPVQVLSVASRLARDAAGDAGVVFRISDPPPALRRIAELCGVEDLLSVE
jgi:hypothetical protein